MNRSSESVVEEAALDWLESIAWRVAHGPGIAPGEAAAKRSGFGEVVLSERLRAALAQLNPTLPAEALEEAFRKITIAPAPSFIANNRVLHRLMSLPCTRCTSTSRCGAAASCRPSRGSAASSRTSPGAWWWIISAWRTS